MIDWNKKRFQIKTTHNTVYNFLMKLLSSGKRRYYVDTFGIAVGSVGSTSSFSFIFSYSFSFSYLHSESAQEAKNLLIMKTISFHYT